MFGEMKAKLKREKITPLFDNVVLEEYNQEMKTTNLGIIIPDTVQKQSSQIAKVVFVGPGRLNENNQYIKMSVEEGDTVLFNKYSGTKVSYDGHEYLIVSERDILAILPD